MSQLMVKNGFNNCGFESFLRGEDECPISWGMRLRHGVSGSLLQGIVDCFKTLQQKMWDFISGRNKDVK
jgi:hypothetical protein